MSKTVIGILAGMGPRSTSPFLDAVLDNCARIYGARWDGDFPDIALYSLPTPYHPNRELERGPMVAALTRGAKALVRAGADFMAMPCNTAHMFYDDVVGAARIPILHIVACTLPHLIYDKDSKIAVLATQATRNSGMYHDAIAQKGGALIEPPGLQGKIENLLNTFDVRGADNVSVDLWYAIRDIVVHAGAKQVVLGCTDLAFCSDHIGDTGLVVHDSSAVLATETVKEFCRREGISQQ